MLLELLFEKCEQATHGDEAPTSASFDEELQEFVRQREHEMCPILTNDSEIDNLVSRQTVFVSHFDSMGMRVMIILHYPIAECSLFISIYILTCILIEK